MKAHTGMSEFEIRWLLLYVREWEVGEGGVFFISSPFLRMCLCLLRFSCLHYTWSLSFASFFARCCKNLYTKRFVSLLQFLIYECEFNYMSFNAFMFRYIWHKCACSCHTSQEMLGKLYKCFVISSYWAFRVSG